MALHAVPSPPRSEDFHPVIGDRTHASNKQTYMRSGNEGLQVHHGGPTTTILGLADGTWRHVLVGCRQAGSTGIFVSCRLLGNSVPPSQFIRRMYVGRCFTGLHGCVRERETDLVCLMVSNGERVQFSDASARLDARIICRKHV